MTTTRTITELEAVIERGMQTYVEVGEALEEIREAKLYREDYATFEDYCRERWGMARQTAYDYLRAAEVAENVRSSVQSQPSFTQARELASLPPEQQVEVAAELNFAEATVKDVREAVAAKKNVHHSSESEEWYTPAEIVERVVAVLGRIELDPCSNAAKTVPATAHFTKADDGLSQQWSGSVFMNPPYGRPIAEWADKLVAEYKAGRVTSAIALVPARVDTDWWRTFREYAVCFVDGRLKFSGHKNSAPFPSALIYLGGNIDRFHDEFKAIGDVWVRWHGL